MSRERSIHLFNCDRTYKLDIVEDWLEATKPKLGFEFSVEPHYFSLSKMSEMSNETIPGLQMEVAVFVVHAHESRLSINEQNAGIGYAKIYRALLQKTENNVIIVIGGDDNYKDETEEDREFISRWAKRKVSSQFSDEVMDGRKSFIFSWDKKHRKIHEEALLHFFDRGKKGQKFEPQPPQSRASTKSVTRALPRRVPEPSRKEPQETKLQQQTDKRDPPRCDSLFETNKAEGGFPSTSNGSQAREHLRPYSGKPVGPGQATASPSYPEKRDRLWQETNFSSTERNKQKDLSVLGWKAKPESLSAVTQLIQRHRDKLNLADDPDGYNATAVRDMISYLEGNPLKYCVLVVDAEKVRDASDLEQRVDYLRLLQTAEINVEVKIIIVVCIPPVISVEDETVVTQTIANAFNDNGKVLVAWFVNGQLTPPEDELIKFLTSFNFKVFLPPAKTVMLMTHLRQGRISNIPQDIEYWKPGFVVPDSKARELHEKYSKKPDMELTILLNERNELLHQVDKKKEKGWQRFIILGLDETVMLQTRIKNGVISFNSKDVFVSHLNWPVPRHVVEGLKSRYRDISNAELFVISSSKGDIRCVLRDGGFRDMCSFASKNV